MYIASRAFLLHPQKPVQSSLCAVHKSFSRALFFVAALPDPDTTAGYAVCIASALFHWHRTFYKDESGKTLMCAAPSDLSPASEEYEALVRERAEKLREANPDTEKTAIPVDLVTCSGSGLDPHISPAAAEYQVARIAKANDMAEDEVREIVKKCTEVKFLGVFGEETVNVLKVNLMLDGIL